MFFNQINPKDTPRGPIAINWGHPLARDINAAHVFSARMGFRDLAAPNDDATQTNVSGVSGFVPHRGREAVYQGGYGRATVDKVLMNVPKLNSADDPNYANSVALGFANEKVYDATGYILTGSTSAYTGGWSFSHNSSVLDLSLNSGNGYGVWTASPSNYDPSLYWETSEWFNIAASCVYVPGESKHRLYGTLEQGPEAVDNEGQNNPSGVSHQTIHKLFSGNYTTHYNTTGWASHIYFWHNRCLTQDERLWVNAEPFDLMVPYVSRTYFLPTGAQTVQPTGMASTLAFGSPTVQTDAQILSPPSLPSTLAFGAPTVAPGAVAVEPTGLPSAVTFGSPEVVPGAVVVLPPAIASTLAFGAPTVTAGGLVLQPTGMPSTLAFGGPTITPGTVVVAPTGLASALAFGGPTIVAGAVTILPPSIASTLAFGAPTIQNYVLLPPGIPSSLAFGGPTVQIITFEENPSRDIFTLDQYVPPEAFTEGGHAWLEHFLRDLNQVLEDLAHGQALLPIEYLYTTYDEAILPLGTRASFQHLTYGNMEAVFCQFTNMSGSMRGAPIGFDKTDGLVNWKVTNNLSQSAASMVLGLSGSGLLPVDDKYGWVITRGPNIMSVPIKASETNTFGTRVFWSAIDEVSSASPASAMDLFAKQIVDANRDSTTGYLPGELLVFTDNA